MDDFILGKGVAFADRVSDPQKPTFYVGDGVTKFKDLAPQPAPPPLPTITGDGANGWSMYLGQRVMKYLEVHNGTITSVTTSHNRIMCSNYGNSILIMVYSDMMASAGHYTVNLTIEGPGGTIYHTIYITIQ